MKKSMCCNEDMIYMGKGKSPIMIFAGAYIYCCYKCGKIKYKPVFWEYEGMGFK